MIGLSLIAVSACFGFFALWAFRRMTDPAALRNRGRRLYGHVLEFRLFYDEPLLIWRAQVAFARENFRLLILLARPALMMIPIAWLVLQLECVYGYAPLAIGQPAIITAQISSTLSPSDAYAVLEAPAGLSVESPPVRSTIDRQISWRIRPLRPFCSTLSLHVRGAIIGKSICAGTRRIFLTRRRARSLISFLLHPEEPRLPPGEVAWVEIDYPESDVTLAGIALPWVAWFMLLSLAAGIAFARLVRVPR